MLLAFYKPYGVLCQFTPDQPGQRTLGNFAFPPGVYPLGRLDLDSEGLLLLSDEPGLNTRLLDASRGREHPRRYWAQVEGVATAEALALLGRGVLIQNQRTRPARAWPLEPGPEPEPPPREPPIRVRLAKPTSWIALELIEGRNRQVRRMTAAVGFPTLRLIRVGIGGFDLWADARLAPGVWRALDASERQSILQKQER